MTQLDRIEQKLDRLLRLFGDTQRTELVDARASVFAAGGVDALKQHMKAESDQRSQHNDKIRSK